MKCQFCSNPATVHLTNIENNQKKELHLCQKCAEEKNLVKQQELNLPAILQTLIGQHVGPWTDELSRLACPHDYEVFRPGLEPLLKRIHRKDRHAGKRPRHHERNRERQAEVIELRRRLRAAVESEAYEEAARLRDILREKESHG